MKSRDAHPYYSILHGETVLLVEYQAFGILAAMIICQIWVLRFLIMAIKLCEDGIGFRAET